MEVLKSSVSSVETTPSLESDGSAWVPSPAVPVTSWDSLGMSHSLFGLSFLMFKIRTKMPTSQYDLEKIK